MPSGALDFERQSLSHYLEHPVGTTTTYATTKLLSAYIEPIEEALTWLLNRK